MIHGEDFAFYRWRVLLEKIVFHGKGTVTLKEAIEQFAALKGYPLEQLECWDYGMKVTLNESGRTTLVAVFDFELDRYVPVEEL